MFKLALYLLGFLLIESYTAAIALSNTSNPSFWAQPQSIFNGPHAEIPRPVFRRTSLLMYQNRKDIKRHGKSDKKQLHRIIISVKQLNLDILESIVDDISDPNSINFGRVKSRAEIATLTDHSFSSNYVVDYLNGIWRGKSFTTEKSVFGEYISVTAPIELLEDLLETTFEKYSQALPKSEAPVTFHRAEEYSLPAAIANHIHSVFLAIDLPPVTRHRHAKNRFREEATEKEQAKNPSNDIDVNTALNTYYGSVTPSLLNTFYSITNNTGFAAVSQGVYSAIGQTLSPSDLKIFQNLFGLPQQAIHSAFGGHVSDNACQGSLNDCAEANLNVQYLMAVCQSTPTNYYYWNSTTNYWEGFLLDLSNRVTSPLVVSISYGSVEAAFSTAYLHSFNVEAMKLAAQGVTLIASSGDDGANYLYNGFFDDCEYTPDFPASSPFVTAVGATQGPELNEVEVACSSNTNGVITSGGGFSESFRTPVWQQAAVKNYLNSSAGNSSVHGYNGKGRGYPDVSLMGRKYAVVLGGVVKYLYGTSASAPVFAGMVSLVNAARAAVGKGGVGWINPSLYKYSKQFSNDITSGNNKCLTSGGCCPTGFTATHGWDPVTGLGSINFAKFKDLFVSLGDKLSIPTLSPSQPPQVASQKSPKPSSTANPSVTAMPTVSNSGWLYKYTYGEKSCGGAVFSTYSVPLGTCLPKYVTGTGNYSIEGYQVFSCNNGIPSVSYFFREGCSFANNNFKMSESYSTDCIDTTDDAYYYAMNTQNSNALHCSSSTSYLSTFPTTAGGEAYAVNTLFGDRRCSNISAVQAFVQYTCIHGHFSDGISTEGGSYVFLFTAVLVFDGRDCKGPHKMRIFEFGNCTSPLDSSIAVSQSWSTYTVSANPTITPTGPSLMPSPAPTFTSSPTFSSSVSCASFSTTYASDCTAADTVCPSCSFTACPFTTIHVKLTNSGSYDYQYFYLFGPSMEYLYSSSITEGYYVSYTFYYDGECTSFTLAATCGYGSQSCGGAYLIGGAIAEPSAVPSRKPTGPSVVPTSLRPTKTIVPSVSPSKVSSVKCPFYQAFNTSMATKRFSVCSFYACDGANIYAQPQYDTGTVYARLYDGSGYMVSSGIYVYYTVMGTCQTFTLHQGCYDYYYPSSCSGSYVVTNVLSVPSSPPSTAPTGPSLEPSATPRSTTLPSGPTQTPSFTTAVDCGDFSLIYPNTVPCYFSACGGQYLSISPTSYSYAYLLLFDSSGEQIQSGYYSMILTTPVNSECQTYTLELGCGWYYYCTGSYKVFGGSPAVTSIPTALPSGPSLSPSVSPSKEPTVAPSPFTSTHYCRLDSTGDMYYTASSCYFYACPGKELRFNAVKSFGSPYLTLRDSIGSFLTFGFPPFSYTTTSKAYAKCQTYKLTESCGYGFYSGCSATIRIDGGAAPPTKIPSMYPSVPTLSPSSAMLKPSGLPTSTTSQPTVNISETYYYSNISVAFPSLPTTIAPSPGVTRKWVLGTYGQSCDATCASFQSSSSCSASSTGLFAWPLTEEQLSAVRSNGVYDIVSRVVLSGDGLCLSISQDSLGSFPGDPTVSGHYCYYGGQRYADRGECSAVAVGGDRRFCPCLINDRPSTAPTRKPSSSLTIKSSSKPSLSLTSAPAGVFGSRTWVLGTYGQSCDATCVSFQSSSSCSADSTGLFAWPLTAQQLRAVRSNGVFDIVSRVVLSGDGLCLSISQDSLGSFPGDPTVSGHYCYYGGQRYADRGECSAVAVGGDRRFCPCLTSGPPSTAPTRTFTNISETYYYSNIKSASPSPSRATTPLPTVPSPSKSSSSPAGVFSSRTWVLGAYGKSCNSTCASFQPSSSCSADSTGLFAWPLTEEQLRAVRSTGVYDIVSRVVLSGDGLCLSISQDSLGSFPDDPTVSGHYCYYGGQRYADRGECSAVAVGGDRRFCPCLINGVPSPAPTWILPDNSPTPSGALTSKSASPQTIPSALPTYSSSIVGSSAQPSSVSTTNEISNYLPTVAPGLEPLISMQQSLTLLNIALSSLTAEFLGILQSSIRAAVANITSIPIEYISTPILSSLSTPPQRSLLSLSFLQDVVVAVLNRNNLVDITSTEVGVVATYSIVGPTSVINAALNTTSGESSLASVCSTRLSAHNGSALLTSIKAEVRRSASAVALLTLLANTTIAKITVVLVPPVSPSASPVQVSQPPTYPPTNTALGTSSDSSNTGLYVGVAVAAAVVATLLIVGSYFLLKKYRTVAAVPKDSTNSSHVIIEYNSSSNELII